MFDTDLQKRYLRWGWLVFYLIHNFWSCYFHASSLAISMTRGVPWNPKEFRGTLLTTNYLWTEIYFPNYIWWALLRSVADHQHGYEYTQWGWPAKIVNLLWLFTCSKCDWSLTRHVKLRVAHAPGMPGTLEVPAYITAGAWPLSD